MPREPSEDPLIHQEIRYFPKEIKDDLEDFRVKLGLREINDVIELFTKRVMEDEELVKKIFDPEPDDIDTRISHFRIKLPETIWDFYSGMKKRSWRMKSTAGSKGLIYAYYLIHKEIKKNGIEIKKKINIKPQSS